MALKNLYNWSVQDTVTTACGAACGASDKPEEVPTACGAADTPAEEKATACGAACGASDKE